MAEKKKEERINDALLKVALGCSVAEVTEEYAEVDGALRLTKRKKTKRDIPPDLKAVQLLMASSAAVDDFSRMSDEDLQKEKERLLNALKEGDGETEATGSDEVGSDAAKKPRKPRAKPRKRRVVKQGN